MTWQVTHRTLAVAAWLAALSTAGSVASAQEDPFGAAAPKPAADAAAAKKSEPAADAAPRDPLVIELLRRSNPAAPQELLRAAHLALQYGRADETKKYLAKLIADKPGDDALAPWAARYADFLLAASREPAAQPEGRQAADLMLSAAQRVAASSERIQAAIAQLSDSQASVQQAALQRLFEAGIAAVNPLLQELANPDRAAEHAAVRAALVQLASFSEMPLLAALVSRDAALQKQVAAVLGRMRSRRAAPHFIRLALDPNVSAELRQLAQAALSVSIGAVPDMYEADKYLRREIGQLLAGEVADERDVDDRVQVWTWNDAERQATPIRLPSRDAGVLLAARLASDLAALRPADAAARRLMLLTNLEWAKIVSGLDRPLPQGPGTIGAVARAAGAGAVNQVLADALSQGRIAAAIAACEVLGAAGDASVLEAGSNGFSPLTEAVRSPDRRVRLAAALAAVKLSPNQSFSGAGLVSQALAWLAIGGRGNAVLVAHPREAEAQSLIGLMNGLGYEGETTLTGRALAERAFANPDVQFILITDAIDSPPVEELVQWLRRDFRTARMPIAVLAREERFDALHNALAADRFTAVLPRVHSEEVAASTVNTLQQIGGRNLVHRDERTAQAQAALSALAELAHDQGNFARYELLRHEARLAEALNQPALASSAAALLGQFGTPGAQTALVEFASQESRALADRQAAAAAFTAAVKSRGLRLTQLQIEQQFARYNASERLEKSSQDVLGSILDTIEFPAIARGELSRRE